MSMLKKISFIVGVGSILLALPVFAFEAKETSKYFNGPTITEVTDTSATVSLSQSVIAGITDDEKKGVYFEYDETMKICIMIYPTPPECLPKKTEKGQMTVHITNLKPDTEYRVIYRRDNTIQCITTPCEGNEFESLTATFKTKKGNDVAGKKGVTSNLRIGTQGEQVKILQGTLVEKGYFTGTVTGYFGPLTLKAVKAFQKASGITPTGYVGELTRRALSSGPVIVKEPVVTETFEGLVTAYSTGCYADGECSITVDTKKVVTTIGWSREIVGKVLGVSDLGAVEKHIGSRAKVYAKKTADGYTLYGDEKYYVQIMTQSSQNKPSPAMSFFVTSKNKGNGADFGGIAGADAYCQALAESVGVTNKTWVAYLSTTGTGGTKGVNAKDRIGYGPWYNYNGELIAQNVNELHGTNNLNKKTAFTEHGDIVLGRGDSVNVHDILTGSNDMGMSVATTTDTTCNNWTSSDTGSAYVGHHDRIGINESAPMKSWVSSHLSRGCSLPALRASGGGGLLYCFAK